MKSTLPGGSLQQFKIRIVISLPVPVIALKIEHVALCRPNGLKDESAERFQERFHSPGGRGRIQERDSDEPYKRYGYAR